MPTADVRNHDVLYAPASRSAGGVAAAAASPPAAEAGSSRSGPAVLVAPRPEGVDVAIVVIVDGARRGEAPLQVELEPGEHEVRFEAAGRQSLSIVRPHAGERKTVTRGSCCATSGSRGARGQLRADAGAVAEVGAVGDAVAVVVQSVGAAPFPAQQVVRAVLVRTVGQAIMVLVGTAGAPRFEAVVRAAAVLVRTVGDAIAVVVQAVRAVAFRAGALHVVAVRESVAVVVEAVVAAGFDAGELGAAVRIETVREPVGVVVEAVGAAFFAAGVADIAVVVGAIRPAVAIVVQAVGTSLLAAEASVIAVVIRTLAVRTPGVAKAPPKTLPGRHVAGQFLRCGTSAGANCEEARGAESKADFIHKLSIVLKKPRESRYWLRIIARTALLPRPRLTDLLQEADELANIIARSILTARSRP